MAAPVVTVVRTGTANLASVLAGIRRVGAEARIAARPDDVRDCDRLVLPGVGALAAAMETLRADGLVEALVERIGRGRPTLAVCLGLQLLFEGSAESPGTPGLAALPGSAERFPSTVRVPQLGWNLVVPDDDCRLLQAGHAYFANSYRIDTAPPGWRAAWSDHGGRFVAAIERGAILACQFHPELSGAWGSNLLRRWLDAPEDPRC